MSVRYGIGEWYGYDFSKLSAKDIQDIAKSPPRECPFRFPPGNCNKKGGVCSLRQYSNDAGNVVPADNELVTTCPNRFAENGRIFSQVAELLINTNTPTVATEIPFLMAESESSQARSVGMIDMVLADRYSDPISWCAMEIQAVYFSGKSMSRELQEFKHWKGPGIPFPGEIRRPDFRSSGPKRLMPQLQIKVPTISRWGKKTAVIVDRSFWNALSKMLEVKYVSNCDIAWFIMDYKHASNRICLGLGDVVLTTLNDAVVGLTGGVPTSLQGFERNLEQKIGKSSFTVEPG